MGVFSRAILVFRSVSRPKLSVRVFCLKIFPPNILFLSCFSNSSFKECFQFCGDKIARDSGWNWSIIFNKF